MALNFRRAYRSPGDALTFCHNLSLVLMERSKACIKYSVSGSMLRDWTEKEETFKICPKSRRSLRKESLKHLGLEKKLLQWVSKMRSDNRRVQIRDIRRKAIEESEAAGDLKFKASNEWARGFMARSNISVGYKLSTLNSLSAENAKKSPIFEVLWQTQR